MPNNYNERHPPVSFRTIPKIMKFLEKEMQKKPEIFFSVHDVARDIIERMAKGDLIDKKSDLALRSQELKNRKTELEIEMLTQRIAFRSGLASASVRLKPITINQIPENNENIRSPYDESNKRLQCIECGCLFGWKDRDEYFEKAGELKQHLMIKHDRQFNALEKEVIDNLTYEGDST